jgi:uncharacterized membrane protein YhaH (DUF805 family)
MRLLKLVLWRRRLRCAIVGTVPLGQPPFGGGDTSFGQGLPVVVGALVLFAHYIVAYVFSGMTAYLIYGYIAEGDGRMDRAWGRVRAEFWNIAGLAAASTLVSLIARRLRDGGRSGAGASLLGGALGGLLEAVWTEASFLILPAMMIEDTNLPAGIKRATQIAKGNLLLIGVGAVGVRWITGLIGFVLGVAGLALGLALGYGLVSALGAATGPLIVSIGLGALVFFAFVIAANFIGTTYDGVSTCSSLGGMSARTAVRPVMLGTAAAAA